MGKDSARLTETAHQEGGYNLITVNVSFMLYLMSSPDMSVGKKVVPVELKDGATFGNLLEVLEPNFGPRLAEEIFDPRTRSTQTLVRAIINGVLAHNLEDTETVLHQGDSVIFVPVASGG